MVMIGRAGGGGEGSGLTVEVGGRLSGVGLQCRRSTRGGIDGRGAGSLGREIARRFVEGRVLRGPRAKRPVVRGSKFLQKELFCPEWILPPEPSFVTVGSVGKGRGCAAGVGAVSDFPVGLKGRRLGGGGKGFGKRSRSGLRRKRDLGVDSGGRTDRGILVGEEGQL